MKEKLMRFFAGRYGTDDLNRFLFVVELILFGFSFFTPNLFLMFLFYVTIFLYLYRSMSRNYVARSIENQKFIKIKSKLMHTLSAVRKNLTDKGYKHFVCPNCAQIVRVPKGKGIITITCPSCRTHFDKRS